MEFSRQEYWSGLPFPPLGALPLDPGMQPASLVSSALAGGFFITTSPEKPHLPTSTHCQTKLDNAIPACQVFYSLQSTFTCIAHLTLIST